MTTIAGPPNLVKHLWKSTLLSGLLAIILGAVVLAWPGKTILVAIILFGVYLVLSGLAQVVLAFSLHVSVGGRVLLFISGAASIILAVLAFRFNDAVVLLAIWIAIGFIFRGVATTVSALDDPDMPGRWGELFFGVISLIAGIVVLALPLESLEVMVLVAGISLVVIGVTEVVSAYVIRKAGTPAS